MKIFGHPVHVMLIHFPSALFPMDFVCSLLGSYYKNMSFGYASFYAMTGGVLLGTFAIIAGAFDLLTLAKDRPEIAKKALIHGSVNITVTIAYGVLAYHTFKTYPLVAFNGLPELIFKGCLVGFLLFGNYLGGNLILKDKVGIES